MRCWISLPVLVAGLAAGRSPADPGELVYVPNSTRRVCQLTGDLDRSTGKPTLTRTGKRFGVEGTDLGSSFEHDGKLFFLFGDTWGRPGARDALAWTTSTDPEKIDLDFPRDKDGKWLPLTVTSGWFGQERQNSRCGPIRMAPGSALTKSFETGEVASHLA